MPVGDPSATPLQRQKEVNDLGKDMERLLDGSRVLATNNNSLIPQPGTDGQLLFWSNSYLF